MSPSLVTGLLDLLAPARCTSCRRRAALPWCGVCAIGLDELPDGCRRCAAPPGGGHACWPRTAPIDETIAVYDYRGPVAAAVVSAKLGGARAGWKPLAAALARRVRRAAPDVDVVTWITTPAVRARSRGADHAEVLAIELARELELPSTRLLDVDRASSRGDRYRARHRLPGSNVLLVDDVVTTGATAVRAAHTLRAAGAGRIVLAVVARAGSHPLAAGPAGVDGGDGGPLADPSGDESTRFPSLPGGDW